VIVSTFDVSSSFLVHRERQHHIYLRNMARPGVPDGRFWGFDTIASVQKAGALGNIYALELSKRFPTRGPTRPGEKAGVWFERSLGQLVASSTENRMCLQRFKIWWMRPVFCRDSIPWETIMILCRDEFSSSYRLILPSASSSLHGRDNGEVILTSDHPDSVLYSGVSIDPYRLIEEGVAMITGVIKTNSTAFDYLGLGWCSWNAFYTQISGEKMVEAVGQIKANKIPIQWTILDDGWQHTTNDKADNGQQWSERLAGLDECPTKFDGLSLKDTVSRIKKSGLTNVWVWHTLAGYWLGLDPANEDLPASSLYFPEFPRGIINIDHSAQNESSVTKGVGIPDDMDLFFSSYHKYLLTCGIDGVKVDAQALVSILVSSVRTDINPSLDSVLLIDNATTALARSIKNRFVEKLENPLHTPPIIHCMAHDPKIFYKLPKLYPGTRSFLRASDDHYPDNPFSHGSHIVSCAFNSLLLGQVSIPDWDMFTTALNGDEYVRLHAVSRCVSGGPVYVSDPPNKIRKEVIDWVSCSDGTILTCRESAIPILGNLLEDPLNHLGKPLVVYNTNGGESKVTSAVFAAFNVAGSGEWSYESLDYIASESLLTPKTMRVVLKPADIPYFDRFFAENQKFLAVPFFSESPGIFLQDASSTFEISLDTNGCDLVTIYPLATVHGVEVVPLGFKGKINGAGAIVDLEIIGVTLKLRIKGCGTFVLMYRPCDRHGRKRAICASRDGVNVPLLAHAIDGEVINGFETLLFEVESFETCQGHTIAYDIHVV